MNSRIVFRSEDHTYWLDGEQIPNVSTFLDCVFPGTYDFVDPDVLETARQRGEDVHKLVEIYERFNMEDKESYMYYRFEAYKKLKEMFKFEVEEVEVLVFYENGLIRYAGTIDIIGVIANLFMIADVKTYNRNIPQDRNNKDYMRLVLQLTAYANAFEQMFGRKFEIMKLIHLPNGRAKFLDIERDDDLFFRLLEEHYPTMLEKMMSN